MLDTETKRKIDTARDILVGKVPDPKSQVEQITIALIYKFMDDMDKEGISFGGKASFFVGEYDKYSWTKIFDPKIGGHEMLNLYGEAIVKLNHNPNIPQLFRDIFKNAYLPYRDPETLKMFLKTINEFHYDHSEKLGDAFEYLLSVLGSQGDAGQFRTPRHIIDFIIEVLQPKKNETICDPACGTAGFLISSYKHIIEANSKKHRGDLLTPDERKKLMKNFVGYDISPDMVRLSLVNMYLHGFIAPNIYEYDTLTSEDRWGEYYDVIMANPPFMSPTGGIKPHKKFTIQAKRSEVLFVDYIAEHIHPSTGRAGIIVPEGIIFQSKKAYKSLRKMLVENNLLYAVVSLPAGIFQPYANVKTSILLMDRTLAKKTDKILFVKIENDGFDLGAQRRAIDKNDLTGCLELLQQYKQALQDNTTFNSNNKNVFLVENKIIAGKDDYNLSIDRYRVNANMQQSNFNMVSVEDLIDEVKYTTKIQKSEFIEKGKYPVIDQSENFIAGYWNNESDLFKVEKPIVVFGDHTRIFKYVDFDFVLGADGVKILLPKGNVDSRFFYYCLQSTEVKNLGYSRHWKELKGKKIPLPPLEIQQQIVSKIEGYQAIINGAKQVVENYKPQIDINAAWEMVELGEIGKVSMCKRVFKEQTTDKGDVPFYKIGTFGREPDAFISQELFTEYKSKFSYPKKGDILISTSGTIGKTVVFDGNPAYFQDSNIVWIANDETKISNKFLNIYFQVIKWRPMEGVTIARLYNKIIEETKIPLPSLSEQQQIVNQIQQEQQLVNATKELIKLYEQKIKDEINKLWQSE